MALRVHALYLLWVVVLWLAIYQAAYWAVTMTRRRSLVCWSVGLFGVAALYLTKPPLPLRLAQLAVPALLVGGASYVSLYVLQPAPISGLDQQPLARLATVATAALVVSLVQLA